MRYAKANRKFWFLLRGPWYRPAPKRAYPVAILRLALGPLTYYVQGDVDQHEAAVDRRAARFHPFLLDPRNDCLP